MAGSGAIAGATSITLKSMLGIDGDTLTMAGTFGSIGYGTLEPGNGELEEQISFTGLTNNANGTVTLTGISSVSFVYPYTATSGLAKTHAGSTTFVISNTAGFYNQFVAKDNDGVIDETLTFTNPNYPRMDTDTPFPTDEEQFATKGYADSLAIAGAPDASLTQKGIVEIATTAEIDAGTAFGGATASPYLVVNPSFLVASIYNTRLPSADQKAALASTTSPTATNTYISQSDFQKAAVKYGTTTGSPNAYVLTISPSPTAYTDGMAIAFKANFTNTTSPTIAINGLTPTIITNCFNSPMVAGEIKSGQIVEIVYNGTNFQTVSPPAGTLGNNVGGVTGNSGELVTVNQVSGVDTSIRAVTIPAMGANDYLDIAFDALNTGASQTWKLKIGSDTLYVSQSYTNTRLSARIMVMNRNATNSQVLFVTENTPFVTSGPTAAIDLSAGGTLTLFGNGANTNSNTSQFMVVTLNKNQ